MAPFPLFRLLSVFAFSCLLFVAVAQASPDTSPSATSNPDALWVLGRSALAKRAAGDGQWLLDVDMASAHALAVNPRTGGLWVFTLDDELQHRQPDGTVDWRLPHVLPLLTSLVGAKLLPDAQDGSVWLVGLNEAVHVDGSGAVMTRISTLLPITAAALDTKRQQLWLATPLKTESYDASGNSLSHLADVLPALVRELAYDSASDRLWAATPTQLLAYQAADRSQLLSVRLTGTTQLAPDGAGNLWVGSANRLTYLDGNGNTQFTLPHPVKGALQGMAANPVDHSVWLTGLHQLVKVQADGSAASPLDVPASQAPLASLGLFVDDLPPVLSITAPADGALIANVRPPLTLAWSDQGSGVDPASLAFTDNQQPQDFSCQPNDTGASCTPASDLPQGVNNLVVTVKDKAGNTSAEAKAWWRVDTIAPEISFTGSLQPGFITNQVHALLTGTLNESGSVSVNGTQIASNAQQFSAPVTLTEGSNHINVSATDLAGNTRTITLSGTLDTQPPAMPITANVTVQMHDGSATLTGKAGAVEADSSVIVTNNRTGQSVTVQADANGAFTASLAAQAGDTFSVQAGDAAGNHSDPVQVRAGEVPPDPATVAPPLPSTGTPPFVDRISFLYSGFYPIQKDVAPGTIEAKRAAVLTGKVMDTSGNPLPGVKVTVLNHPEFGYTHSQASGNFDMAVNGGGQLTLVFTQAGYLPVQRHVQAPWQGWAHAKDVAMTKLSSKVSTIDLTNTVQPFQVAQGEVEQDSDGTRQATLLFPAGETATITLADGSTQTLPQIHLRATEFTVGENGPAAMPGPLPATTAYTYAVNFTIDEASEAVEKNGSSVTFSQPVPVYVNNFLDFPVGEEVPVGYYDPDKSAWVPYPNGRIVKVLSIESGQAQLDVTGAGTPATPDQLATLGITSNELTQLATLYQPGDSLWRFAVTHFSSWDCNWPYGPPEDAGGPKTPAPGTPNKDRRRSDEHNNCPGCEIDAQAQSMGESIPVAGTPFSLHYNSARVPDAQANHVTIELTGDTLPASLEAVVLEVDIAGQHFVKSFSPTPNQSYTFVWDGKDNFDRFAYGEAVASITLSYQYPCVYFSGVSGGNGFGQFGKQAIAIGEKDRCQNFRFPRYSEVTLSSPYTAQSAVEHWGLSIDHSLNRDLLLLGNGHSRRLIGGVIQTIAGGTRGNEGDGGPAVDAKMYGVEKLAMGADGSLYILEAGEELVRKVSPDGIITTVAGNGHTEFNGDGIPATQAGLDFPHGFAIGPDGSLYIADTYHNRIRKVSPDGIISTFAGTGADGLSDGDGGPAVAAKVLRPTAVAVAPDGSVYFSSHIGAYIQGPFDSIRKVSLDGIIETVVSGRESAEALVDGMMATKLRSLYVGGLTIGPDGDLYIATEGTTHAVLHLTSDGRLRIVAGYNAGFSGDGGLATLASLNTPKGIAFGPAGGLYIADAGNKRIRLVTPDGVITTVAGGGSGAVMGADIGYPWGVAVSPAGEVYFTAGTLLNGGVGVSTIKNSPVMLAWDGYRSVISKDGTRRFVFNANGNILRTENASTGAIIYAFQRNVDGQLLSVTDAHGKVTTIERNPDGTPTAIVAPNGQVTQLTVTNDQLTSVTDPTGATWNMAYTSDGLMTSFTNRTGVVDAFTYDADGRLITNQAPNGHGWNIVRTVLNSVKGDYQVAMTSGAGNTSNFVVTHPIDGTRVYTNTAPDGTVTIRTQTDAGTTKVVHPDGSTESITKGPDPRFGMAAPVIKSDVITTPSGLTHTLSETRTATVPDGVEATQPTSLTNQITVNSHTTTSTYTASNHTWLTTSPAGRTATTVINDVGQPLSVQAGSLTPVQNQYDAKGRLSTITRSADGTTRTTTLNYVTDGAAAGYLQAVTGPLGLTVSYQRDANGRVTQLTRPDGQQVEFAYDAEGRLTSLTPPDGSAHVFTYDANGSRTGYTPPQVGSDSNATVYHYNADLQPTEIDRPDGKAVTLSYASGKISSLTSPVGSYAYAYNATTGQLSGITAPGGESLAYSYDGPLTTQVQWSGAVTGSVGATYNNDFAVTAQSVNSDSIPFTYDADGLLTQAGALNITRATDLAHITGTTLSNVTTANTYNGYGELASDSASVSGNALFAENLSRDLAGRIIEKQLVQNGTTITYGYHYDTAGRLDYVTQNGVTITSYTYDANGNRLKVTTATGTTNASYDAQDRLTAYGSNSYAYNAAGDLTSKTTPNGTTQYNYDALGNLRGVALPDGKQITYLIDGQNRRVGKQVNGTLQYGLLYQNQLNPVAMTDEQGNVTERFVYGDKANVPAYLIKDGTTYRIISDYQGSVRLVVNASTGEVAQQLDYDAFGQVTKDTAPGFQPFGYAGGLYDPDTKLTRFGARDYDAETGRWTAKDPILFAGGQSNLYGYVMSDPVNFVDTDGLLRVDAGIPGVGTIPVVRPNNHDVAVTITPTSNGVNINFTVDRPKAPKEPKSSPFCKTPDINLKFPKGPLEKLEDRLEKMSPATMEKVSNAASKYMQK